MADRAGSMPGLLEIGSKYPVFYIMIYLADIDIDIDIKYPQV